MSSRFHVGDVVRTRSVPNAPHTRLPRYLAGREARVIALRGTFPLADERALGMAMPSAEPVYTVGFDARAIFGPHADHVITADLWESYLEHDA